uniref:Odorant receptor n=2 Tax=Syrphini TaxID=115274 RepID=A0A1B3B781_SCAPY|nr:putative odorant receptor OR5 [Scaeva pyrastri]
MEFPNLAFKLAFIKPFRRPHETKPTILAWILFSIGAGNLVYQNFGMLIAMIFTKNDSIDIVLIISETGSILGLAMVALCKMTILFAYRKDILSILEELENYFPGVLKVHRCCRRIQYRVKYFAEFSRKMMKITTIFFMFAFLVYNLIPVGQSLIEWLVFGLHFQYRYQSNTWYPWNGNTVIRYTLSYVCQVYSSLAGVAFIMAGEFMLCFFLTQMRMHFDFLARALESLDAVEVEADPGCMNFLIQYHTTLIRLTTEINHIFNISFCVNFATSSVAICLMGCSMVMGISLISAVRYSIGLLSFLVFTLFICYNGSIFTQTSAKLHSAAFYHNWYDASPKYRKTILIIIMRAAKPSELQAYKFSKVSMETFMDILKFSYKLFTFFRAME